MSDLFSSMLYGIGGGLVRLIIDLIKTRQQKKKLDQSKFLFYMVVLIVCGAFSGILFSFAGQLSFLGGYAGMDLIDGYYKHFKRKKFKIRLDIEKK